MSTCDADLFFLINCKILASSVVGATAEEDEGNDDESQASGQPQIPKENCYEVVGTVQDPTQHKPEWVDKVFEVCAPVFITDIFCWNLRRLVPLFVFGLYLLKSKLQQVQIKRLVSFDFLDTATSSQQMKGVVSAMGLK